MALNCIVVSGTGRIPEQIQLYLKDARFFEVLAVVRQLSMAYDLDRAEEVHYLLMDQKTAQDNFTELLKRKDQASESHRILVFGAEEVFVIENLKEDLGALILNREKKEAPTGIPASVDFGMEAAMVQNIQKGTTPNSPVNILVKAAKAQFSTPKSEKHRNSIFVRSEARISRIKLEDLLYVEAQKDYMVFHTTSGSYRTLSSMKKIEKTLDADYFFRLHRSFIVRLDKIHTIQGDEVLVDGTDFAVPIGPSFKNKLIKRLELL